MRDFVNEHGADYFTCQVGEVSICCSDCKGEGGPNPCGYCFNGDCYHTETGLKRDLSYEVGTMSSVNGSSHDLVPRDHPHSVQVRNRKSSKQNEPCPPDYSKRGYGPDNPYEQTVWWTLLGDKADQFYADLMGDTGIPKDKIQLKDYNRGNGCPPSAGADDTCWYDGMDYGMPTPVGYHESDVSNPKDVVQKALDNSDGLQQQLADTLTDLRLDAYYGDGYELVDSISVPVLMIADAVDSMSQVEVIADKIDAAKKKAMILAFLSAILFFIPIAGEVAGSVAGLADLASVLAVLGAAGDLAMGVYTIVDDPNNPLLGILDIVLAPLALTSLTKISGAANLRRGMSDDDIVKLGGKIGARMGTIKKVIGTCRKL